MKPKIIFFDIDRTIFDYRQFLNKFYNKVILEFNLSSKQFEELEEVYRQTKKKYGYFAPDKFLGPISERFPQINRDRLNSIFWDKEIFENNIYEDSKSLFEIAKVATIGIFSEGEKSFQKQKITKFKSIISDEDIYIFRDKINKLEEVLRKYNSFKIYLVDDHLDVLSKAKSLDKNIFTILINRINEETKDKSIDAIVYNLNDILPFLI